MNWKILATVALLLGTLTACSVANRLVYRIDINQGNYMDQALIQDLRFGMTKEQIVYVLGPPTVTDPSQPKIWYYIHWLKPGHDAPEEKKLILEFDANGLLNNLQGDFKKSDDFYEFAQTAS